MQICICKSSSGWASETKIRPAGFGVQSYSLPFEEFLSCDGLPWCKLWVATSHQPPNWLKVIRATPTRSTMNNECEVSGFGAYTVFLLKKRCIMRRTKNVIFGVSLQTISNSAISALSINCSGVTNGIKVRLLSISMRSCRIKISTTSTTSYKQKSCLNNNIPKHTKQTPPNTMHKKMQVLQTSQIYICFLHIVGVLFQQKFHFSSAKVQLSLAHVSKGSLNRAAFSIKGSWCR